MESDLGLTLSSVVAIKISSGHQLFVDLVLPLAPNHDDHQGQPIGEDDGEVEIG